MMSFARIGSTVTLLTTIGEAVAPVARTIGFAASPLPVTFTPPFTPAAAWWMWNRMSMVLAGQPVTVRLNPGVGAGVAVGAAVVGAAVGDGAAAVPPHAAAMSAVATRLAKRRIATSLACI